MLTRSRCSASGFSNSSVWICRSALDAYGRLLDLTELPDQIRRKLPMADKSARGHFVWHELLTPDADASHGYYAKVLGWKSQPWEQDPSYKMFAAPTGPLGGTASNSEGPARW